MQTTLKTMTDINASPLTVDFFGNALATSAGHVPCRNYCRIDHQFHRHHFSLPLKHYFTTNLNNDTQIRRKKNKKTRNRIKESLIATK